jgi:hypothetical protein
MKPKLDKNKQKQLQSVGLGHQHTPKIPNSKKKKKTALVGRIGTSPKPQLNKYTRFTAT